MTDTLIQKLEALKIPKARFSGDAFHIHNAALEEAIKVVGCSEMLDNSPAIIDAAVNNALEWFDKISAEYTGFGMSSARLQPAVLRNALKRESGEEYPFDAPYNLDQISECLEFFKEIQQSHHYFGYLPANIRAILEYIKKSKRIEGQKP